MDNIHNHGVVHSLGIFLRDWISLPNCGSNALLGQVSIYRYSFVASFLGSFFLEIHRIWHFEKALDLPVNIHPSFCYLPYCADQWLASPTLQKQLADHLRPFSIVGNWKRALVPSPDPIFLLLLFFGYNYPLEAISVHKYPFQISDKTFNYWIIFSFNN